MCSYCSQAAFQNGSNTGEGVRPSAANGINFTVVTGDNNINGLLSGLSWSTNDLTWRMPMSADQYDTDPFTAGIQYGDLDRVFDWLPPTATMASASSFILNEMFAAVSGLTFTRLADGDTSADLTIGRALAVPDDFETAYAYYPSGPGDGLSGDSWFSTNYDRDGVASRLDAPKLGGYNWLTYVHEFGHNMGLKHGHETDGVGGTAMNFDRDSMEFSVMTYRGYVGASTEAGYLNEQWGFAQSLMMYDIAALQVMYGANFAENGTDSVYTFSTKTGEMFVNGVGEGTPGGNRIFRTVWDGNGIDTYDLSNYTSNLSIDLNPGAWSVFSSVQLANLGKGNYARGNLFNALQYDGDVRSLIENAIGGSGKDRILGNDANNTLTGNGGADTINGGNGIDTARYASSTAGVTVNLGDARAETGGHAKGDVLISIENIIGSNFADSLTGDAVDNLLQGLGGADRLFGGAGADILEGGAGEDMLYGGLGPDILNGGEGFDLARYDDAAWGDLVINMANPNNSTGPATGDSYLGIEGVVGGLGNDAITGDANDNQLSGLAGNDVLDGGIGNDRLYGGLGADTLIGGDGFDFACYDDAASRGLIINLMTPSGNTGNAFGDTYFDIEGVIGSVGSDTITGNSLQNNLQGGLGNDTLNGGLENDVLLGGSGADKFVFNTALDAVNNVDTISDFTRKIDDFVLSQAIFAGIGSKLDASEFQIGPANSATDRIIYIPTSGQLFYDSNGNGDGGETLFATVNPGTALTIGDFIMIA